MTIVKKTKEHKIIKRRDGRYAVKNAAGQPVNGDDKVAILQAEGLLVRPEPKPKPVEEENVEESAAEETAEQSSETESAE